MSSSHDSATPTPTGPLAERDSAAREGEDHDIERLCEAARVRLEARAGLGGGAARHYRRPTERPFTATERNSVTILFGGLTVRHERLIQAIFESCGQRCQPLPQPDIEACLIGKQYCNNGVCNPAYFTVGNLVKYLQQLEASGLTRQEICDRYVFFTAGGCGPCRFGMYEAEYRLALRHAGFEGFRVLLFQQEDGVKANTGEQGLELSLHLGLGAVNAFNFADALQGLGYAVRPFETTPGATDQRLHEATERVADLLRNRRPVKAVDRLPSMLGAFINGRPSIADKANIATAIYDHLYGPDTEEALRACREAVESIEVDRLRVKPVVKVTGEFWAQTTESDGNFNMFAFLEREGAQVAIEPLASWVLYLIYGEQAHRMNRRGLDVPEDGSRWRRFVARTGADWRLMRTSLLLGLGGRIYHRQYERTRQACGSLPLPLVDQRELARLAMPYYHHLARGGEGHLEVGKSIYYTSHQAAHMILSLKPFGCMPSTQSDGVQSLVAARFKDMIFLPIETGAEGELSAHSRVQMALVEARTRAQAEFQQALSSTGRQIEEIRAFVAAHPELRRLSYPVPRRPRIAGVAANFVLHVGQLMDGHDRKRSSSFRVPAPREVTR